MASPLQANKRSRSQTRATRIQRVPLSRSAPQTHKRTRVVLCLVILTATFALYSPVGSYPFINYDDPGYVAENRHVQEGLSVDTIAWAFTATEQANWHPLTWIAHAMDYELFGLNAGGHHVNSVILHVLNGLLLFWLLVRATGRQ